MTRHVVITGAAGGIGTAVVRRFLDDGHRVCAVDKRADALEGLVSIMNGHPNLITVAMDVSSPRDSRALATRLTEQWGVVDVLFNNAGLFPVRDFVDITVDEWREVLGTNLDGPFLMTQALLGLLTRSSAGRVINTSSGSIYKGLPRQAHYVASKAGVIGLTRSLANVLGEHSITCNAITPGVTATPPVVALYPADLLAAKAADRALKRQEEADDLVGAVVFFASDDAAFITGQTLNVDGGTTFH